MLLDTSSLMYRAFFALPDSITGEHGRPVNALHGYVDMTARLIGAREPDEVVHCFDADWKPAPRVAAYAGYKAERAAEPEALGEQFEILPELLEAAGMDRAEAPEWEAEDAIGTLCARAGASDRVDVVTGDRDLIQVVRDPVVRVIYTLKGVSQVDVLDEARVERRFGVPASRYADFATLRGDPSDGLPGVRGVGEKTARQLVAAYPSLDELVADAQARPPTGSPLRRSPALRARVRDAVPYLEAMRRVVPIRTDLEVREYPGRLDRERLEDLARHHGVEGPVRRLREALERQAG